MSLAKASKQAADANRMQQHHLLNTSAPRLLRQYIEKFVVVLTHKAAVRLAFATTVRSTQSSLSNLDGTRHQCAGHLQQINFKWEELPLENSLLDRSSDTANSYYNLQIEIDSRGLEKKDMYDS